MRFGSSRCLVSAASFAYFSKNNNRAVVPGAARTFLTTKNLATKLSFFTTTTTSLAFTAHGSDTNSCSSSSGSSSSSTTKRFMSDEVKKAQEAAASGAADGGEQPTIFDKLLSGEWKSDKVYEDDTVFAFRDVNPQAPVHIVVIPKHRDGLTQLSKARDDQKDLLGHLLYVAGQIGKKECPDGFRITINDGKQGSQSVYHLHLHITGGRQMGWPPG